MKDVPEDETQVTCQACGARTERDSVSMTLWASGGLVVIEDVPAHVCVACGEQYYDDPTQAKLRDLASGGFARKDVVREITVPVYSLAVDASTDAHEPDERQTA